MGKAMNWARANQVGRPKEFLNKKKPLSASKEKAVAASAGASLSPEAKAALAAKLGLTVASGDRAPGTFKARIRFGAVSSQPTRHGKLYLVAPHSTVIRTKGHAEEFTVMAFDALHDELLNTVYAGYEAVFICSLYKGCIKIHSTVEAQAAKAA